MALDYCGRLKALTISKGDEKTNVRRVTQLIRFMYLEWLTDTPYSQ
jgi:hypothetical protein